MRFLERIMKKSKSPLQISLTCPDSQKKFEIIKIAAKANKEHRRRLIKAYKDFFLSEHTVKRIINRIEREVDLKEFGRLALSNINIVHEILPEFISSELKRAFENVLLKGREITENSVENLYSSKDFRSILNQRVILNIIRKWI